MDKWYDDSKFTLSVNSYCDTDLHGGNKIPAKWRVKTTSNGSRSFFCCPLHLDYAIQWLRQFGKGRTPINFRIERVNLEVNFDYNQENGLWLLVNEALAEMP